ncbi:MAG: DNA gyrase subunit A [Erysipelotrichales bacterium]|nr:DNA gyrase subunit A [Erysipelotrichales bacterium]
MANTGNIVQKNIVTEIKESFLDYSMSVIVARALPDLRDGLKPVHRRILYSMYENGYTPDKPFRKSAKTVGEVMGNYHPHGDVAIYDAMVRMAQPFSYRNVLIEGHGNFGSMDGDGAAAMRYTEARLSKLSLELLRDIKKETVDFVPNFDDTTTEPSVIPSRFPNILVNGTIGIAVGMATNIPPHNLGETIDGCIAYIDNQDITTEELMNYVKGPDFPTGAVILGNSGIRKAYETGKGTITLRGKVAIEESNGHQLIVITELPYMVNKKMFQQRIAELVRDKLIDGIADLHEETNLENGVKIVITLKKDANANVVLNNLYKQTTLQSNFSINFLMLDQQKPRTLGLKEIIAKYIEFQKEIIIRRTKYDLGRAEERVHILNGYRIALENIDEVVKIIRGSDSDEEAKQTLSERFGLTDIQTEAILEMRLRRLTGLEKDKILNELEELLKKIEEYKAILANDQLVLNIIKEELSEIKDRYADERRTYIDMTAVDFIDDESLIPEEDIMISITDKGYIKRCISDTFKSQHRGGVGVKGMSTNEEDYVKHLVNCSTHDYVTFFTNKGKVYRIKGYEIPEYSRQAKGLPIINLLQIEKDERINSIVAYNKDSEGKYLIFATKNGIVKRTLVDEFANIRVSGKIAITLKENDELLDVKLTDGSSKVILGSSTGRMVVFDENEVRPMGRTASGVKGINLDSGYCTGMEIGKEDDNILVVTKNGFGKKTFVSEYRMTKRGSKGVKALSVTDKNGALVAHKVVNNEIDLMIITDSGMLIRLPIDQISQLGRVTQGVKLINLKDNQYVSTVSLVDKFDESEEEDEIQETEE